MAESPLKKVACPSCGAPLLFGAGEITTRCQFCHAVVERPARADLPAVLRSKPAGPQRTYPASPFSPAVSFPGFNRLVLILGILIGVGVVLLVVLMSVSQSLPGLTLILNGPVALFPTDQPEGPDFISLSYDISGETYLFIRLNPVKGKVVWRGKKFKEISDVQTIVTREGRFFAVEGTDLLAYSAADGAEAWQAKLSDQLGYCEECLSVEGDRVIVLTRDYVIQAFDTETGTSAWQRRMDGYTEGFTIADGGLWVIDKVGGKFSLLFLNLEDGTVQRQITPECRSTESTQSNRLDSTSMFILDPAPSVRSSSRSVYLLYGYYPGCVDRWDASSATLVWQAEDDKGYSPSREFATLFTPDMFFLAYEDTLWSVTKAGGQIQVLAEGGDYELVPLALEQGTLIVRTKRTRGTQQFGLRGVDPAGRETLWEYAIENGEPFDPPDAAFGHVDDDRSIWLWRMIDGQLRLVVFQADPNQVTMVTIDPKDGSASGVETLAMDFDGDSYFGPKVLAWRDTVVWVVVDARLMAIDVSAVKVKYKFP